jgi:serine/threonine protein kinase
MVETNDNLLQQIPRYNIMERIGTGGMARVYRALDTNLDRDVAVKVLHEHLADDDLFRARFEREAKFIASLRHPNVVQIFDYATLQHGDQHLLYMVMPYLPGKNLKEIMDVYCEDGTTMPITRLLPIVRDVADALDYAHALGMVHRDIKPANILFDERGGAVLSDFGIARLVEGSKLTQENIAVGTPAYMAPEQAAGESVDTRTDIYAFGVIIYELLTGQPPFGDDGSISVLIRHLNEPVPPLASANEEINNPYLDAVIEKALAKAPDNRYQTASALFRDLEMALQERQPAVMVEKDGDTNRATMLLPAQRAVGQPGTASQSSFPLGLLSAGLALIVVVLAVGLLLNRTNTSDDVLVRAPALDQPPIPTATATLNPRDFRNFGGVDSMVEEEPGPESMTSADNMSFTTGFSPGDEIAEEYWSTQTTMSGTRTGEVRRMFTTDGQYLLSNSIRNLAATTIVDTFAYDEDITIVADLQLDEGSMSNTGYGLVFHHMDDWNYGVFAIDGEGRFSIWFLEDGIWRELRNAEERWTESDVINRLGEMNRVRLDIRGATLTGFVNDEQVVQIEDGGLSEGGVGIYLANPDRETAVAQMFVDEYAVVVEDDQVNAPSSMTGDG